MAVKINNIDEVLEAFAKMDKAATGAALRQVRKRFRATVRRFIPVFKNLTPKKTGASVKSIKIKSRTRRGVTSIRMTYNVPYAPFANLSFNNEKSRLFANKQYHLDKTAISDQGTKAIREVFKETFEKHGIKVK